ncbi:unnamed protein product [Blepharisma stoltei]|uniref:CDC20/Fizzy WD40 domain-containing protein n=1 Tax=Blepharisma stoltei TaxID=1481888 RepID=A0AAU9JKY3_9CILI|nr:unnamed protein product [Blepharisma stoltei]
MNVLDWSCNNLLAVALNKAVYLWSDTIKPARFLHDLCEESASSLSWSPQGTHLAIGTSQGKLFLYDVEKEYPLRCFKGHNSRIGTLSWNSVVLSSGSRDQIILQHDFRSPSNYFSKLSGHKQEICGLKWSFDGEQLASGGNDNKIFLWSSRSSSPVEKFSSHTAAVKAIAWSPHQRGLLASGGGTADKTIKFWDTFTLKELASYNTYSQVCNIMFSKTTNELVSTHGFSQHEITVWSYPNMQKIGTMLGHTKRVLYLAMSADGQNIVTGAGEGDETLRFWNVFPGNCENFGDFNFLMENEEFR